MKKTTIRPKVGTPAPDRYLQHVEVHPRAWFAIWRATAPQAKRGKKGKALYGKISAQIDATMRELAKEMNR